MASILEQYPTFGSILPLLMRRQVAPTEVVAAFLEQIRANEEINAFLRVYAEEAIEQAQTVAHKFNSAQAGPLAGLVVGLKDMISYKGHPLQAGSKMLANYVAPFNATVTERLLAADALVIGHQNCDEFGMGSSSENPHFGAVLNPIDQTRVAGGSSGGSAAAVKAKMCHVSIGTDTGGSVRQPAAFCGLVGLKPSYGRISRHGLVAYASSFDAPGILAHTVEDCARVLNVLAGPDGLDATAVPQKPPCYLAQLHVRKKYKIAYLEETLSHQGLQSEIQLHTLRALDRLKKEGHQVDGIHFELLKYALPTYYVLVNTEASTNLARYDGIRYGHCSKNAATLREVYVKSRTEGFAKEVKKRIMLGTFVLSTSQSGTHYVKATKVRARIKNAMEEILRAYDFIVLPTTTATAFRINSFTKNSLAMYWSDLYTVLASVAGLPAISLPNGVDDKKLPIGIQVIANYLGEDQLLSFAHYFESMSL